MVDEVQLSFVDSKVKNRRTKCSCCHAFILQKILFAVQLCLSVMGFPNYLPNICHFTDILVDTKTMIGT